MMKEPTLSAGNVGPGTSGYSYALVSGSIWLADNHGSTYVYDRCQRYTSRKMDRPAKARESIIGHFVVFRRPYHVSRLR